MKIPSLEDSEQQASNRETAESVGDGLQARGIARRRKLRQPQNPGDGLVAGASGYLIKRASPQQIIRALVEVHRGGAPMSSAIARKVVKCSQKKPAQPEGGTITKREQEILTELAEGYRDKEITDRLAIGIPTVRTHVRNIYDKLHVRSREETVARFLKSGESV